MGAKKKENSKVLKTYLDKLNTGVNYTEIARSSGSTSEKIIKVFAGQRVPPYDLLVDILDYFDVENIKDVICELSKKDGVLLFNYWDNIYPEEVSIKELRQVIIELMKKKKLTSRDVAKKFNTTQNYISSIVSGNTEISYNCVKSFSEVFDITPVELINKLKNRQQISLKRDEFTRCLVEARQSLDFTAEHIAEICKISVYRYIKIEQADVEIKIKMSEKICKVLKLDLEYLGKLAIEARVLFEIEEFEEIVSGKKNIILDRNPNSRDIEEFLFETCRYKRISSGAVSYNSKAIVTLLFLILSNEMNSREKFKGEIIYYLTQLRSGNDKDIYKKFDFTGITKSDDVKLQEIFARYKDEFGYSFLQIAKLSGFSKGYISNRNQSKDFLGMNFIIRVLPAVNIPLSIGVEVMIKERLFDTDVTETCETITVNKLVASMKKNPIWTYLGEDVSVESFKEILKIIFGTGDSVDKYRRIQKISLPESYKTLAE